MFILFAHLAVFGALNLFIFAKLGKLLTGMQEKVWLHLLLGYAITSILFNIWVKLLGYQGQSTIVWIYLIGFLLGIFRNLKQLKMFSQINMKSILPVLILLAFLSFFNINTESKSYNVSDNYWHSANADVFDGLCGAQSILDKNSGKTDNLTDLGINTTRINSVGLLPYLKLDARSLCSNNKMDYLGVKESLQYTNLALFSDALRLPVSMYVFLFQSILNLLLFFNMLIICGKKLFFFSNRNSKIFAGVSVFSHLYFITFINGHIGSMMIQAPLVILIVFISEGLFEMKKSPVVILILSVFVGLAYPYIVPFVVIYFLIVNSVRTDKFRSEFRKLFPLFTVISFTIVCWFAFSAAREKATWAERAWGTFLNPLGPLQYLGLLPGNINGIGLLGFCQQWLIKFGVTSTLEFWIATLFLTSFILFNIIVATLKTKVRYPGELLFCALAFPIIIGMTSHDSYYVYKISYIFQFVVIGFLIIRIQQLRQNPNSKKGLIKQLSVLPFQATLSILLISNLMWNGVTSYQLLVNNSKWSGISKSIGEINAFDIDNAVLQTDSYLLNNITSFVTQKLRPLAPASLVRPLNVLTIIPSGSSYSPKVERIPVDSFWLSGDGISSSESDPRGKFRWAYGIRTQPKSITTEYSAIRILRLNSTKTKTERSLCISIPEWDLKERAILQILDQESRKLSEFVFSKKITCKTFEIPNDVSIMTLRTNLIGSPPSLFDTRAIVFRIWNTGKEMEIYEVLG